MLNKKEFSKLKKELEEFDNKRETIIVKSREVTRLSKHAIYFIHNNDLNSAKKKINDAKKIINELKKLINSNKKLLSVNAFSQGMQEYCEAVCYLGYIENKKITPNSIIKADYEDYLLGLCDLTGELTRKAVVLAIEKKYDEIEKIKLIIKNIFENFLDLKIRNSELRKKSDAIKWNLKKIEEIIYDINIKKKE
ncbi:MAG: translin family protein [Nanoarchaeota archaeon]